MRQRLTLRFSLDSGSRDAGLDRSRDCPLVRAMPLISTYWLQPPACIEYDPRAAEVALIAVIASLVFFVAKLTEAPQTTVFGLETPGEVPAQVVHIYEYGFEPSRIVIKQGQARSGGKLKVSVNRPGLQVRHRTGYFAYDLMELGKKKGAQDAALGCGLDVGCARTPRDSRRRQHFKHRRGRSPCSSIAAPPFSFFGPHMSRTTGSRSS